MNVMGECNEPMPCSAAFTTCKSYVFFVLRISIYVTSESVVTYIWIYIFVNACIFIMVHI